MRRHAQRLQEVGWQADLGAHQDELPSPTGADVLVQLQAAGVCYRDLIDRSGRIPFLSPPVVPGHEGVGVVVAVGPRATWAAGQRVATMHRDACGRCSACEAQQPSLCQLGARIFGLTVDGTYASALLAPSSALYAVPDGVEPGFGAVAHCTFGTAWRALNTVGALRDGEAVLITGANGGVGQAALQIAARRASRVVAVVRREGHEARLRELGATDVVVSADNRFHKQVAPVDLALECVGAPTFNASLRATRVGGRVSVVGNVTDERVSLNLGLLITMGKRILGPGGADPADMAAFFAEHGRRPFADVVTKRRPLAEADAAQRDLLAGGAGGRTVLLPDPPQDAPGQPPPR